MARRTKTPTTPYTNPVLIIDGINRDDEGSIHNTVGNRIAHYLSAANVPAVIASPSGVGPNGVRFDWRDRDTWPAVFENVPHNRNNAKEPIRSVYLVAPSPSDSESRTKAASDDSDIPSLMMDFVDFARGYDRPRECQKPHRFVLQSASAIEPGGPAAGKVHAYLRELGTRGEIEWAVLRPTWFQQTLAERQNLVRSIRDESRLYSATGDGKVPWLSADDLATVAVQILTRADAPNTEFIVLGPELLSYDDIAAMLSDLLGRKIVHIDLSTTELVEHHLAYGIPGSYAQMLSSLDTAVKFGSENRTNDVVLSVTGVSPRPFREFLESAKTVWAPVSSEA